MSDGTCVYSPVVALMQICRVHPGRVGSRESECSSVTSRDGSRWKQVRRGMLGVKESLGFLFSLSFFFLNFIYLFIFGCVGSSLQCAGFSLQWLLLLRTQGSVAVARGLWSTGSVVVAHGGLVAPRLVGSSRTRARTRVPCTGRWTLNHCTTREVPFLFSCTGVDHRA